ncbi:MAG: transposase [Deltaproteobacteria bacterium]|nr:transposase [Deltaproteobacteria bacterium]
MKEAEVLAEQWRLEYNHHRPHSSSGCRTLRELAASGIL